MDTPVRIGISSCLLGNKVRWNGGHQLDRYLAQTLGQFVEFVPVCPETECGLGIPRETMHLSGLPDNPRLVTSRTSLDKTDQMKRWGKKRLQELANEDLCGFIFKTKSPSSGMRGIKVFASRTQIFYNGVGIFARMFMDRFPRIPAEDDGRLHDPGIRDNFIERIFTLRRWRDVVKGRPTLGKLVDFHTRHKLLLLSHSQKLYREMGPLVAAGKKLPPAKLLDRYEQILLEALSLKTTVKKQINVLMHVLGYFKKQLSADEKQEMLEIIERYRNGFVPLVVPITLVNHYVRKYDQPYLKQQVYIDPTRWP